MNLNFKRSGSGMDTARIARVDPVTLLILASLLVTFIIYTNAMEKCRFVER